MRINWDSPIDAVQAGWTEISLRRPFAAWAIWKRVSLLHPEIGAAAEAIELLKNAVELPAVARTFPTFIEPTNDDRRRRWNSAFEKRTLDDPAAAEATFADLARRDADDSSALFNQAICLAWMGENRRAIEVLDRFVSVEIATGGDSKTSRERAVKAWRIAEVLRQGAGAEPLCDDLSHAIVARVGRRGRVEMEYDYVKRLLGFLGELVPIRPAESTANAESTLEKANVFELRRRASNDRSPDLPPDVKDLSHVIASIVFTPEFVRMSSPDPRGIDELESIWSEIAPEGVIREATPLPPPLWDAAIWTFRLPADIARDHPEHARLVRAAVENWFENVWITLPRHGLGEKSPRRAAGLIERGDREVEARLAAIVDVREQLGRRPSTALLYQGYPFDRLRRRLGLPLDDPETVDREDLACASGSELDRLEIAALTDSRLIDAFESSLALGDDSRSARFAEAALARPRPADRAISPLELIAPIVRNAIDSEGVDAAIGTIENLVERSSWIGSKCESTLAIWRGELHARAGRIDEAFNLFQNTLMLEPDAAIAFEAAASLSATSPDSSETERIVDLAERLARESANDLVSARIEALRRRLDI